MNRCGFLSRGRQDLVLVKLGGGVLRVWFLGVVACGWQGLAAGSGAGLVSEQVPA